MFEKVKALIADKLSINEDEITMESAFVDDSPGRTPFDKKSKRWRIK